MFTDTDSITYEIKPEDVYEDFFKNKHLFDFSEYQSKCLDSTKKKNIGKIKDKFKGISVKEIVELK